MANQDMIDSLEHQLRSLYEDRETINSRFGVSSAEEVISMVECLEAQLKDFYSRFGTMTSIDDTDTALVLSQLQALSSTLDPMFGEKQVVFEVVNEKPALRAVWKDINSQGDA